MEAETKEWCVLWRIRRRVTVGIAWQLGSVFRSHFPYMQDRRNFVLRMTVGITWQLIFCFRGNQKCMSTFSFFFVDQKCKNTFFPLFRDRRKRGSGRFIGDSVSTHVRC